MLTAADWRLIFRFDYGEEIDMDLTDYHEGACSPLLFGG